MSWLLWLRVVAVTVVLVPFVQAATRYWAGRVQVGGRYLRVLETCSLGNDGRLHLVEVAGKVYALAAGAKGYEVIQEVTSPEVLAELRRGEGVRGEALLLPQVAGGLGEKLVALVAKAVGVIQRPVAAEEGETSEPRAIEVLQGHLARAKRLNSVGDEALAVGKR